MAAVDWPDLDELKRTLDVDGDDWNAQLESQLTAAIDHVKGDVGSWDESTDTPTAGLHSAALRAAVVLQANAGDPKLIVTDPVYAENMRGHRRTFGFS